MRYDQNATIVLIGMRGVGKTTLGLIAATSLRRPFIDADSAFQTLHGPIHAFVSKRGWPAFRDAETAILERLLTEHPSGYVIACGGGVVDRDHNRQLLKQFRDQGHPILHVVRDKKETVHYLVDEDSRPHWGEEIRTVWSRREPYLEQLCTHTFANLTANPRPTSATLLMKHVETSLVRLLRSIFGHGPPPLPLEPVEPVASTSSHVMSYGEHGGYGASENVLGFGAKGPRTSFVALNFPDIRIVSGETIRKVADGVDVIELRVDTLVPSLLDTPPDSRRGSPDPLAQASRTTPPSFPSSKQKGKLAAPSLHFVALSFAHLRRSSPLPILYTVRTASQGGEFPDPWDDPDLLESYVQLVELGFKLGAELVDVELSFDDDRLRHFLDLRGGSSTRCLATDHDRSYAWTWESDVPMHKHDRALALGFDALKLVSYPKTFDANIELVKFRQRLSTKDRKLPLLAINLGKAGQISRFLNPVLTPVTHPLLPGVAAPGQITFAQTMQAMYLSGFVLEKTFFVASADVAQLFNQQAVDLGLPYKFIVEDRLALREIEPTFGGAFLGSHAILTSNVLPEDDVLGPAANTGYVDVVVPATTCNSYDIPPAFAGHYRHSNMRVLAIADLITENMSPINAIGSHTSALVVGLSRKDKAEVLEALSIVGARWAFLFACEEEPVDPLAAIPPSAGTNNSTGVSRAGTPLPFPERPKLKTTTIESLHQQPQNPAASSTTTNATTTKNGASRRPPTIVIAGHLAPPFPDSLFTSPTGGCAFELTPSSLREAVRTREGWQLVGERMLRDATNRHAFRALTGRRLS